MGTIPSPYTEIASQRIFGTPLSLRCLQLLTLSTVPLRIAFNHKGTPSTTMAALSGLLLLIGAGLAAAVQVSEPLETVTLPLPTGGTPFNSTVPACGTVPPFVVIGAPNASFNPGIHPIYLPPQASAIATSFTQNFIGWNGKLDPLPLPTHPYRRYGSGDVGEHCCVLTNPLPPKPPRSSLPRPVPEPAALFLFQSQTRTREFSRPLLPPHLPTAVVTLPLPTPTHRLTALFSYAPRVASARVRSISPCSCAT